MHDKCVCRRLGVAADFGHDPLHDGSGLVMLPGSDDEPARAEEEPVRLSVALTVS
jgi:hypothetical protein